ncbi:hypothetical protein [Aestuariivirga sp.]|uniref:hypothetical protein n=1 Tax=Aestuariivirga sp. TaxID=2650926 RepID=UPI003BAC01B7
MSQTETILLFVLGFSLASLLALFAGRLMWTAAVKIGARRMQRQVPSSLIGLQTERNRLRAEYAMLSQRLGGRLEAAKLQMAEHMAEVSRHRNRIHEIETGEAARVSEIRRLQAQVKDLEQSLIATQASEEQLRQALSERDEMLRRLDKKRRKPRPAEAEAAAPPPEPAAPPPAPGDPEARLRQRIEKLTELARASRADGGSAKAPEDPLMSERLSDVERQTADLERDLASLDAQWQERLDGASPPDFPTGDSEADANVISLSNRVRDLKKNLGTSS